MSAYAVLCNPGHNRVYYEQAMKLAVGEMSMASLKMSARISDIKFNTIAGIPYLMFETDNDLSESDLKIISRLSFTFALFKYKDEAFLPVELPAYQFIDQSLSQILKYTGKTNEIFTRLLINLAVFSLNGDIDIESINLLDPVAGKGTTLFEGLICNANVYGIEVSQKVVNEVYLYLKKYLEKEKYKHSVTIQKFSGKNKAYICKRHKFVISRSKEDLKNKETKVFEIISGNSMYADQLFKKDYFHIIAGDLPYGVQHGSVTNEGQTSFTRNPRELLLHCLPSWKNVLIDRGIIALAWNTFVLSRRDMADIFIKNGFKVFDSEGYDFEHRVDQAINRDIIIAEKNG